MALNFIKNIHTDLMSLGKEDRRHIFLVAFNLFAILFSYPFIRSTSEAMFIDYYGAKSTPVVWIFSVIVLSITVFIFNLLQKRRNVFFLYASVCILTTVSFVSCNLLYMNGFKAIVFPYFIWKEVYIILLVHLSIGFLNSKVKKEVARLTYGPLGALGSLGGFLGGIGVAKLIPFINKGYSPGNGLVYAGLIGTLIIFSTVFLFHSEKTFLISDTEKESPLKSLQSKYDYVFLIGAIVLLSQFTINLANFKFNLGVEQYIQGAEEKGEFLASTYSKVNLLSFIFQIFLIPIILKLFHERKVHLSIPLIFGGAYLFTQLSSGFIPIAFLFIIYKGIDYSLFSTAKEMLYFPLDSIQRYGAKYVVDMIVYRFSKMLISVILIYYTSDKFIDISLSICLFVWVLLVIALQKYKFEKDRV